MCAYCQMISQCTDLDLPVERAKLHPAVWLGRQMGLFPGDWTMDVCTIYGGENEPREGQGKNIRWSHIIHIKI